MSSAARRRGPEIRLARVYDDPRDDDGLRVLVDRLWPRGVSRERAAVDRWPQDVAPSSDLRRWWGHDADRFGEFSARYRAELDASETLAELAEEISGEAVVTLVFAARDREVNHAAVLAEVLRERLPGPHQR